ncbi:lytic transglycosylase domain-containing protein [Nocardia niigatensis]|uniref:lytic transglycosylase domain-containing protein n=1 Tax=Nocardia niigatensis TaxID=209249 RepID=UPI0002F9DBAC|nr:lytic transglycosylase domain-containing protein [Nocardia niigatensis]
MPAARPALLVAAVAAILAGCGDASEGTLDPPPRAGEQIPAIRLDAAGQPLDQLRDWARARSTEFGIPVRAIQAYGYATVAMSKAQPGCHLGWVTLAGIARVESDHARFGGATIAADGAVRPPIRGIALDGTGGNARIVDPGATSRTGQAVYARAMGPFQFIPDTWRRWGVRASTDYNTLAGTLTTGKQAATSDLSGSPDNIDDAALAAGRYLCAAGGDLATAAGWRQAILAYNHSGVYVNQVRNAALGYRKGGA